jgi:hypothetical protein
LSNSIALTDACPSDPSIVDFVGYGLTASCFEGSAPTPAFGNNTNSVFRANNGCTDTDDNGGDFSPDVANPRNTSSPTSNCAILSGTGSASPASVQPGDRSTLTVSVTPGSDPASTDITVIADLSSIGGSASQPFTPNGNSFSFLASVPLATTPGQKSPVTISARKSNGNTTIDLTVLQPPPKPNLHRHQSGIRRSGNSGALTRTTSLNSLTGNDPFDLTGWAFYTRL